MKFKFFIIIFLFFLKCNFFCMQSNNQEEIIKLINKYKELNSITTELQNKSFTNTKGLNTNEFNQLEASMEYKNKITEILSKEYNIKKEIRPFGNKKEVCFINNIGGVYRIQFE
jgi:hypothetical protein